MSNQPTSITEFQFHILLSLAQAGTDGLHGYGILQSIEEVTKGLRRYALPSLYDALKVMQSNGLVTLDREEPESGRLRKYFRITGHGKHVMISHHEQTEAIRKSINRIPELRPSNG